MCETPEMTPQDMQDVSALGLGRVDELFHRHIGVSEEHLAQARRLAKFGFLYLEDGPDGPVVTRTAKGTRMLRKLARDAKKKPKQDSLSR